jgi:shikimate kinase/3-dehydroquinate synthase
MGAGKTSIGRRLAARIGLPFRDADSEIELAAGCTIPELFSRYGEGDFRAGERRVIRRLLSGDPLVLAFGGGAFMDAETRAAVRAESISVWLRCPLHTLVRRVAGRDNRPLLADGDPAEILQRLIDQRYPVYGEADIIVDCMDESPDATTSRVMNALRAWQPPRRLSVVLPSTNYEVVIGDDLLARAGALLAPRMEQKRAVVVTDDTVAQLHLPTLLRGLGETGVAAQQIVVPQGEASKSLASWQSVVDQLLEARVERRTTVIALGGGVVGDLAGFAAATTLRGLPFVQVPTTLLAQVDSSVGGKTAINTTQGKNLVGAFYQPRMVLADTSTLATLPPRELRAGYAEIVKAGLIGDSAFFDWCEAHGAAVVGGERDAQAEAIMRACAFKAAVVGDDEREEKPNDGRALLNLGHTFGHALEAEYGYSGGLLHGEGVAVGLGLAFRLSARLGHCSGGDAERVVSHVAAMGMAAELRMLNRRLSAEVLIGHMRRDKKVRDGALQFVLTRGIGQAFTARDVPVEAVIELLRDEGCEA